MSRWTIQTQIVLSAVVFYALLSPLICGAAYVFTLKLESKMVSWEQSTQQWWQQDVAGTLNNQVSDKKQTSLPQQLPQNMIQGYQEIVGSLMQAQQWLLMVLGIMMIGGATIFFMCIRNINTLLFKIIHRFSEGIKHLEHNAERIEGSAEVLSKQVSEQASTVKSISLTLEDTVVMIRQNTESTLHVKEKADTSSRQVEQLRDAMQDLEQSNNEIAGITKTIDDIAFQTNILSLNAAVEAARAGERGREFAVIADEIRGLAVRSATATQDISGRVGNARQNLEMGANMAYEMIESFMGINQHIHEITDSSQQQFNRIQQISQSLNQLKGTIDTCATSSQQNTLSIYQLNDEIENSHNIVADLKKVVGEDTLRSNRQISAFAQTAFAGGLTPSHVFRNTQYIIRDLDSIFQRLNLSTAVAEPILPNKQIIPKDVLQQLYRVFEKVGQAQRKFGVSAFVPPPFPEGNILPSAPYDATGLILAELIKIKHHLDLTDRRVQLDLIPGKVPKDVFLQVLLITAKLERLIGR